LQCCAGATEAHSAPQDLDIAVRAQVDRMAEIVDYQLRRASTSGRSVMEAAVPVAVVARKVADALAKAYRDKQVHCSLDIDPELHFHGDEGDLMEILGNLLDNAYKWCRHEVRLTAGPVTAGSGDACDITLRVEDDGPGMPESIGRPPVRARRARGHGARRPWHRACGGCAILRGSMAARSSSRTASRWAGRKSGVNM
jgi:two-component system sensor histidine kinase PhoQ